MFPASKFKLIDVVTFLAVSNVYVKKKKGLCHIWMID